MIKNNVDICSGDIYTNRGSEIIRLGLERIN